MWVRPQRKPIRLIESGGIVRGASRRDELFDCQGFAPIGSPCLVSGEPSSGSGAVQTSDDCTLKNSGRQSKKESHGGDDLGWHERMTADCYDLSMLSARPRLSSRYRVMLTAKAEASGCDGRTTRRTTRPRPVRQPTLSVPGDGSGMITRTGVRASTGWSPRIAAPEALMFSVVPERHSASPATRYHTGR